MVDHNNAEINEHAIPIGLSTKTFQFALQNRPSDGLGTPFTAFVMAERNKNIQVVTTQSLVGEQSGETQSDTNITLADNAS
jgi:hypothetical protein